MAAFNFSVNYSVTHHTSVGQLQSTGRTIGLIPYSFTLRRNASSSMSIASFTLGLLSVAAGAALDGAASLFFILQVQYPTV